MRKLRQRRFPVPLKLLILENAPSRPRFRHKVRCGWFCPVWRAGRRPKKKAHRGTYGPLRHHGGPKAKVLGMKSPGKSS